jgi:hypothetical protein
MSVENEDTAAKSIVRKKRGFMFQIRQKKRKLKYMKMLQ